MLELEHGVVKFFDDRDGKQFGFLKVLNPARTETGEEIFFHFNDGQFVEIVKEDDDVEFVGRVFPANGMHLWHPKVGDLLAFYRIPGRDGKWKASPWTYAEAYDKRIDDLLAPYYRVTKVTKLGDGGPGDTSDVIWEGRGANALSGEYPLLVRRGVLDDPLAESVDFVAGSTTRYLYERWDVIAGLYGVRRPDGGETGSWQKCRDPRVASELVQELRTAMF